MRTILTQRAGSQHNCFASELTESAQPYQDNAAIHSAIEKINTARPATDEQVKVYPWQIEDCKQTCYLSFDDIGVKHQKERRAGNDEKGSVYVWNTVADIETNQGCHTVTGAGMRKTFLFTLAHFLQHKLLAGKTLVFFTDGARDIFANITEMFSFHSYTVILDWYHLKKRFQEYLSTSVKGKEQRNEILQKLLRILWAGNVDEAIVCLQNLSKSVLRPNNRIDDLLRYIEKHREHIPPYALRAELRLRNSCDRVEKAGEHPKICVTKISSVNRAKI